jgi:hypothetical protein
MDNHGIYETSTNKMKFLINIIYYSMQKMNLRAFLPQTVIQATIIANNQYVQSWNLSDFRKPNVMLDKACILFHAQNDCKSIPTPCHHSRNHIYKQSIRTIIGTCTHFFGIEKSSLYGFP